MLPVNEMPELGCTYCLATFGKHDDKRGHYWTAPSAENVRRFNQGAVINGHRQEDKSLPEYRKITETTESWFIIWDVPTGYGRVVLTASNQEEAIAVAKSGKVGQRDIVSDYTHVEVERVVTTKVSTTVFKEDKS